MPQDFHAKDYMPLTARCFLEIWHGAKINQNNKIIKLLGLEEVLDKQLSKLSTGWKNKANLARALLSKPDVLFLDEPTASFDIIAKNNFYHILAEAQKELKCAIVVISHDLSLVMAKTKRVVCFNGHICCEGKPEKISKHPSFKMLFGADVLSEIALYSHYHTHKHG